MSTNTCTAPALLAPSAAAARSGAAPRTAAARSGVPFGTLSRGLARALAWLRESFEAAGAIDARLRERRDEDSIRLGRSGGAPLRLF